MISGDSRIGISPRAVAAVVAVALWTSVAMASCGDYLHIQPSSAEQQSPSPCSCQSGNCHPPTPMPPVTDPTQLNSNPESDALLFAEAHGSMRGSYRYTLDSDVIPSSTSSGIFHPPRR